MQKSRFFSRKDLWKVKSKKDSTTSQKIFHWKTKEKNTKGLKIFTWTRHKIASSHRIWWLSFACVRKSYSTPKFEQQKNSLLIMMMITEQHLFVLNNPIRLSQPDILLFIIKNRSLILSDFFNVAFVIIDVCTG
jgi:hypothetical protein